MVSERERVVDELVKSICEKRAVLLDVHMGDDISTPRLHSFPSVIPNRLVSYEDGRSFLSWVCVQ